MPDQNQWQPDPRGPLRATAFLSRIPVPQQVFEGSEGHGGASDSWAFPLAGLVIGVPAAFVLSITPSSGFLPLLGAALALGLTTFITGALHEDGLADTADGFWGGWDTERRLAIMKDSAIGTYGVLALLVWFAASAAALASIAAATPGWISGVIILLVAAASRGAMTALWASQPSARPGGVAASQGQPEDLDAALAIGLMLILSVIAAFVTELWLAIILALSLAAIVAVAFRHLCTVKIGGYTGDTLGAGQKLVELAMLTALALALG